MSTIAKNHEPYRLALFVLLTYIVPYTACFCYLHLFNVCYDFKGCDYALILVRHTQTSEEWDIKVVQTHSQLGLGGHPFLIPFLSLTFLILFPLFFPFLLAIMFT
jgi:hypothetical protein